MGSDTYSFSEHESFFWKRPSSSFRPSNFLFEAIDIDSEGSRTCRLEPDVRLSLTMWRLIGVLAHCVP